MDASEIELKFYETFFFSKGLEPYPVQEKAFQHIFAGESLLVSVPTGTGKTMLAKAGIYAALAKGQTAIYTTPLRALTEEKYRELCDDFGQDKVGFATGDYKVNGDAPVQVVVAEILWNRIFGDRLNAPADVVIMDEGHYFNDFERGYVWEQSIIGLDPRTQLVVLSATVGHPERFCQWVEITRQIPMHLVESRDRKVPLFHQYREEYFIEVVKELFSKGEVPAIVFVFGREACFDAARIVKSCRRFTTDAEKAEIEQRAQEVLLPGGVSAELKALLSHGIGIHHAGILPRYKQLVEELTRDRLLRFVVSTETISAGINLPAKRVIFPSLRKYVRGAARIVTAAEYHQMAGRAGRPQFDTEGIAISLAPEGVVQDIRKELSDAAKRRHNVDEEKVRKSAYARAKSDAQRNGDVSYDRDVHANLVVGEPAELRSKTQINAEQVLAIGLPDLATVAPPGPDDPPPIKLPPYLNLNISTVVESLLLDDRERRVAQKTLSQVTDNLKALGIIDEHGKQVSGELIRKLHGLDGLFVHYTLMNHDLSYEERREFCEYLVDHDTVQKVLEKKDQEKKREWIKEKLREMRMENSQVSWEDAEAEYDRQFPRPLTKIELIHSEFASKVPHPQLHGGKRAKKIWALIEDESTDFLMFVEKNRLAHEEGSLFSYLTRTMNVAKRLAEATSMEQFDEQYKRIRSYLATVDSRLSEDL